MVNREKSLKIIASGGLLAGLSVFIAGYVSFSMTGFFSPCGEGLMRTLHKTPVIVALGILMLSSITRAVIYYNENKGNRFFLLLPAGIFLILSGIILSSLTRFEAKLVLTEGQGFAGQESDYVQGSVYSGRWASYPKLRLEMIQVSPMFRKGGRALWNAKAEVKYLSQFSPRGRKLNVNLIFPSFMDGAFYRVSDFGYSPLYHITMPSGETVDEAYVILRLFPPGSEDSFQIVPMLHTFYVKYYPDGSMVNEKKQTVAGETKGPVYKLRVVKNLDLIFSSQSVLPGEKIKAGSVFISFNDIRKWAEISIVKDDGLFIIIPGVLIVIAVILRSILRRVNFLMDKTRPVPDRLQGAE